MNELKKYSLSGVGFTFEKEAYSKLHNYLNSLKKAYENNPDCDEILADIEARIAELILSATSDAQSVVTSPIIENIIKQLGTPEAISGEEEKPKTESDSRISHRLYRDLENAKLGGVCAGLSKRFGVDAVWIRLAISSPLILLIVGAPHLHWLSIIGGNLFGIFLLTYLILWFAIPGAKSARQKLEMEGEPISARSIADRQGATQEEQAKSSVASAVTTFGKILVVAMKIILGLLLFPVVAIVFTLLIAIISILASAGGVLSMHLGELGNMGDILNEFGTPMILLGLGLVILPTLYVGYLIVTLLINRKPRLWVLLVTVVAWLLLLLGTIFAGIGYAENFSYSYFDPDDEVERIMKKSDSKADLSRQIMESLDAEPNAEQLAEIERLRNDSNAISIDK